jgi:hypothetical protein
LQQNGGADHPPQVVLSLGDLFPKDVGERINKSFLKHMLM